MNKQALTQFIALALEEDLQEGDHSSLSCIDEGVQGKAQLLVKQEGVLAGVLVAEAIFGQYDPDLSFSSLLADGDQVEIGQVAFTVEGRTHSILACERLVLNCMQRMSGIATYTHKITQLLEGTAVKLLDTRKTTPNFRLLEKEAVRIGGGVNHRFGLYDMIMLKDNHIDYAGGISQAVQKTKQYLEEKSLSLKIEVEVRNFEELKEALKQEGIHRIMLDNFDPTDLKEAVELVKGKYETEASGGITEKTIRSYAASGVDYISVGALTHQVKSLDLSLKAC